MHAMPRFAYEALGAAGLFAAAALSLLAWARHGSRFSLVAGLGTAYLGFDELLDVHEWLGRSAYEHGWPKPPFLNHHDDALTLLTMLAGLVAIGVFWREVARDRVFGGVFAAGLACFAAAITVDARADPSRAASWWSEETLELLGASAMVMAFRRRASKVEKRTLPAPRARSSAGLVRNGPGRHPES